LIIFLNLIVLIMSLEGTDRSLPVSRVEDHFFTNDVLVLIWNELAGSSLQEDHSSMRLGLMDMKRSGPVRGPPNWGGGDIVADRNIISTKDVSVDSRRNKLWQINFPRHSVS